MCTCSHGAGSVSKGGSKKQRQDIDHSCWHCFLLELAVLGTPEHVSLGAFAVFLLISHSGITDGDFNFLPSFFPFFSPFLSSLPFPFYFFLLTVYLQTD